MLTAQRRILSRIVFLVFLLGCGGAAGALPPATLPTPSASPAQSRRLDVTLLYPKEDSEVSMGQPLKFIAQVKDAQDRPVSNARASVSLRDPDGKWIAEIPAVVDRAGTARSQDWNVPHRQKAGVWRVTVNAAAGAAVGSGSGSFHVENSTSEILLEKYGFWLDAPTLKGIVPQIVAERGDARNGMLRWGGQKIAQHVLPENWVEIQWRKGKFDLSSPAAVRRFMLAELGDLGFTPVREIGPFEPLRFKHWNAWKVGGRGQFRQIQLEWVVFYAPEMDETYSIGTTVVLPPTGIDPHAALRESFAVYPDLHANGIAPEPLPHLLPGPELLRPPMGARFVGLERPIVLEWKPVKELAEDEYYLVQVDYNYKEGNPTVHFTTRETQIALPESLYAAPNCHVFNWQVTLMRRAGTYPDGTPKGEALSYPSLYRYLWWLYPPGEAEPYTVACPNTQF